LHCNLGPTYMPTTLSAIKCATFIRSGTDLIHIATHLVLVLVLVLLLVTLKLRRFKSDRDGIWQKYSSRAYASTDGVGFST